MYFNNRNRPRTSAFGCSSTSLFVVLILAVLMIFGGLFFVFRYLGLIIALGIVVWLFRKFFKKDKREPSRDQEKNRKTKRNSWSRDFEKKEKTSYDNIEREFEEVDNDED
ncbi:MAG: hypothetical protein L0I79_05870 [Atopostipes sp.]|nr:hypothetical protein [Atopostipes sp.]